MCYYVFRLTVPVVLSDLVSPGLVTYLMFLHIFPLSPFEI